MHTKQIAQETVAALERGTYNSLNGASVNISALLQNCIQGTAFYKSEALTEIQDAVLATPKPGSVTTFEVANETTLEGCARLVASGQYERVGALNFASAKHPGGGFLGGAKAQEESLARSSGLYKSLLKYPAFYQAHRQEKSSLYSDRMIYSPACPILRNDNGDWLEQPYVVGFITSPAPNAGAIHQSEGRNVSQIPTVLRERSGKILALAAQHGCDSLVLGAWGCGVFRNDPQLVATIFWEHLGPDAPYFGRFRKVLFSVLDRPPMRGHFEAFERRFG